MRASVQLNATMSFADTVEAVTLTVQALKNNDRVVQRSFTFGNAVPWRPNEYMIRSDRKLVDPSKVNKTHYYCEIIQGSSFDDRFFVLKDGVASMNGLIDYGDYWLVDPGGERVGSRIARADKQKCRKLLPYTGANVDLHGRSYDACGTFVISADGNVYYYDEVSFYDNKGRLYWDSNAQCFAAQRFLVFYPYHHKPQYDAATQPPEYPVPWDVDLPTLVVAARSKKECDFSQELVALTKGIDFLFHLPHVPKTDVEKISKFGRETEGRTVEEFLGQIERIISAQKLGHQHYENKVNVMMNNVSIARQSEIKAYRDAKKLEWDGVIPDDAWERFIAWFKSTNGDVLKLEKAEQAYQLIKQHAKEGIQDYHLRFQKTRLRATANGAMPDDNIAAMRKLFASYCEDLQDHIRRRYTDTDARRNWSLQELKDHAIETCNIEKIYQQQMKVEKEDSVTLLADTPEKRAQFREQGKCFNCGSTEHIARYCPQKGTGTSQKRRRNSVAATARKSAKRGGKKKDNATALKKPGGKDKLISKLEKQGKLLAMQVQKLTAVNNAPAQDNNLDADNADHAQEALNRSGVEKSASSQSRKLRAALNYFSKK